MKWLAGISIVVAIVCVLALLSHRDNENAVAGALPRALPSQFDTGADRPAAQRAVFISANEEAGSGMGEARVRPAPIEAEPQGEDVLVSVGVGSCSDDPPELYDVRLLERTGRLIITAYVLYTLRDKGGCSEIEHVLLETVPLAAPNGDRPIYDGMRWPPALVWPRG